MEAYGPSWEVPPSHLGGVWLMQDLAEEGGVGGDKKGGGGGNRGSWTVSPAVPRPTPLTAAPCRAAAEGDDDDS